MSSGIVHHSYWKLGWILILFLGGCILCSPIKNNWLWTPLLFFNYYWCSVVSPDLDQISITSDEGRMLRGSKKLGCFVGFLGALWVSWWFLYAFLIGLVGGHRSVFSHGILIGTVGRMLFFNFLVFWILLGIGNLGTFLWSWKNSIAYNLYLDVWLFPYLITQFISWTVGDGIHLLLDLKPVEKTY